MIDESMRQVLRNRYELASYIYRAVRDELGEEHALEVVGGGWTQWACDQNAAYAKSVPNNDMANWAARIKKANTIDVEVQEEAADRLKIKVTRCLHYEVLKDLGVPELCLVYCDSDYESARAYNPKMGMTREREIPRGHEICDHNWFMEK